MYPYDFTNRVLTKLTDQITKKQAFVPLSGNLYYTTDGDRAIYATNILDLRTRKVADVSADLICGNLTANADEKVVASTGALVSEHVHDSVLTKAPNQGPAFNDILSATSPICSSAWMCGRGGSPNFAGSTPGSAIRNFRQHYFQCHGGSVYLGRKFCHVERDSQLDCQQQCEFADDQPRHRSGSQFEF